MAQIIVFGRVENDLELKESQSGSTYVCFRLTEHAGKGRTQSYQVWAWNEDVNRLVKLGIKKGTRIWLTGTQELVDGTMGQGKAKTKILKVYLTNFGFIPSHRAGESSPAAPKDPETAATVPPPEAIDGNRETLPE